MRKACRICRCELEYIEIAGGRRLMVCVACETLGNEESVPVAVVKTAQRSRDFKNSWNSRSSASSPARRAGVIKLPRSA